MNSKSYVSRGGLKLESANNKFKVSFKDLNVLDIGSSTGGFTDYALKNGATKVIAIERGTDQIASSLRLDSRVELHEKTDILDVLPHGSVIDGLKLTFVPDIIIVDLSFISLKKILPHLYTLVNSKSQIILLVKPQFESEPKDRNNGIIKNEAIRRRVIKDFENWVKKYFVILNKVDSAITGSKGNKERFYFLTKNISSK